MNIASTQETRWFKRRPSPRTRVVLGVLPIALVVLIALFDWNWFKRPLENAVQARTGRTLHINGNLDVDLGRVTRVTAERIRFECGLVERTGHGQRRSRRRRRRNLAIAAAR